MESQAGTENERLKHLEFIQAAISRLSNNSFLIRGWTVTATGVFLVVSLQIGEWRVAVIALFIGFGFWSLDSSYLRRERMFRRLYDDATLRNPPRIPLFTMNIQPYLPLVSWKSVFFSNSILLIHLPIVAVDLGVAVLIAR
ncbi:hypothetical protein ABZ837_29170 [Streptomyces sp. NPDC047197]|uniref:hypothetical protein n=1 Tax=Streptomyces sp. NPDC047197 TaxID=3155477 RepID=UPI00340C5245